MDTKQDQTQFNESSEQEQKNDSRIEQCTQELQELKKTYMHLLADFDNFKRRQEKERAQWSRLAQMDIVAPLLTIIDDFERALNQKTGSEIAQSWTTGFELIYKELLKYLDKIGIKAIGAKPKDFFNPELHESIMNEKADDQAPNTIVTILQKGYTFKDHVIRPVKVSITES
jgi:molecular chaperone GrpE